MLIFAHSAQNKDEQTLLCGLMARILGNAKVACRKEYKLEDYVDTITLSYEPIFKKNVFLRGLTRPLWGLYNADNLGDGEPIIIYDEIFSTSMIHAIVAKWRRKSPVFIYSFENLKYNFPMRVFGRFYARFVDGALCSCVDAEERVREMGVKNTFFCPYPIKDPAPEQIRVVSKIKSIGYIGRLLPEKGIVELCEAMKAFPELKLVVAGKGPLESQLKNYDVDYLGRLSGGQIDEFYRRVDLIAVPSKSTPTWEEQYGRVNVEAMARGTLVIGSNSGAIPEIIGDKNLIFAEGSVEAIKSVLERLIEMDEHDIEAISCSLRKRYEERFSNNAIRRIVEHHILGRG